jgi:transcriptional regulator with XRE-family HTH domain
MPIAEKLKQLRADAGLTQMQLAVKAGLSLSVVSQIEQGSIPDPRVSTLHALAKALGAPLDALAPDDEPPAEPEPPKRGRGKKGGK